jgi:signal transduction histidine kinase/DNA-binding response OmpR family regulator/streptogramin lyase
MQLRTLIPKLNVVKKLAQTLLVSFGVFVNSFANEAQVKLPIIPISELSQQPTGALTSIHQGPKTLWIGSESGLLGITGNHVQQFNYKNSPLTSSVNRIMQDKNGILWLITENNGIVSFDPSNHYFTEFNQESGLNSSDCFQATISKNTLYAACRGGLYKINILSNNVSEILSDSPLYKQHQTAYRKVASDKNGYLILVGADQKLYRYSPDTRLAKSIDLGNLILGAVKALFVDNSNTIWVSTMNNVYRLVWQGNEYEINKVDVDIQKRGFINIFEDSADDIWFSDESILKFDKKENKLVYPSALSSTLLKEQYSSIVDMTEGRNGEIYAISEIVGVVVLSKLDGAISYLTNDKGEYVTTIQSLTKLNNGSFLLNLPWDNELVFYHPSSGNMNTILEEQYEIFDFQVLSSSEVLFVEAEKGLNLLDLNSFNIQQLNPANFALPSDPESTIGPMNIDEDGNLFISILWSSNGIYKGTLKNGFKNFYPNIDVISSFKDRAGNLLFATYSNGVIAYTASKQWRQWKPPINIGRPPYTRCMEQDIYGVIWLCQTRHGLAYLDDEMQSVEYIDRSYTADSDVIRAVISDSKGYLWVATSQGLVRYDHQNKTSIVLGKEHGIIDTDFYYTATKLVDEKILIAGDNVNYIIDTLIANKHLDQRLYQTSEVQLMNIQLSNRDSGLKSSRKPDLIDSLQTKQVFELTYNEFLFTLDFAINNFIERDQFNFEYRLLGLNDKWTRASRTDDSVTYTTLPHGSYTFEIRAIDARSIAEQPITRLLIKVLPPYWLTTQAYLFYALLILLILYGIYRYRTRQLTQANVQLENAVIERTHELESKTQELSQSHAQISNLLVQKESLFANVSHEFRTPLTLILGPMPQLRLKLEDESDIQQFDMMHRNTKRLAQLVEQILELARLDTAVESPKQVYAIETSLGILVNSFKPLAGLKSQSIVFTNHCWGGLELTADALEKILYNLLSNAIKYSPEAGTITITGEQVHNQFRLSVQDTGCGIPEEELDTIFERFTRLERTAEQLGSGLGLAVVKELVQANGGTIKVSSNLNEGTTFTVTLPLLSDFDESQAAPLHDKTLALDSAFELVNQSVENVSEKVVVINQHGDSDDTTTHKPVLLIIEDNQDMQHYIQQSLRSDYDCLMANNGQQGIDMAIEHIPDMIISDLMMPFKDGFEVVDTLRNNELTAHIPITLLTAKGDDNSRLTGWQKTVDDYIAKPFNTAELRLRLSRLLSVRDIVKKRVTQQLNKQGQYTQKSKAGNNDNLSTQEERPSLTFSSKRDEQFYARLMQVIEGNYTDSEFGRKQAADAMAVSERQLNRKLSAVVEYNFAELVRKYRLEKAKALLLEGHRIGEVGYDVGFTSPSYFSHCFKATFNYTPKQFLASEGAYSNT